MAKTPSKKSRAFGKALIAKQAKALSKAKKDNAVKAIPIKGTGNQAAMKAYNKANAAKAKKVNVAKSTANQANAAKAKKANAAPAKLGPNLPVRSKSAPAKLGPNLPVISQKEAQAIAKKNAKKNPVAPAAPKVMDAPKPKKDAPKTTRRKTRSRLGGLSRLRRKGLTRRLRRTK